MPRRTLHPDIGGLLDLQYGLVRRDQVVGAAVTDAALRWRLSTGEWQTVLPSVYACFTGQLSDDQRIAAGQLYCGPAAQLTGPAALRLYAMRYGPDDDRVHMLVPHACHVSSVGFVVVHRTHRPDAKLTSHGFMQVASVPRAVADTARMCTDLRTVRAVVAESVQLRLATVTALADELASGPRKGSALLRQVIDEVAKGVRSAPEAQLRDIAQDTAVLPEVHWNPALVTLSGQPLPTPDGWIDDVGIALEVDSREHHATPDGWARTLQRHNILASHGALVLHFTPHEVYVGPEAVRRTMVDSYLQRLRSGAKAAIRLRPPS